MAFVVILGCAKRPSVAEPPADLVLKLILSELNRSKESTPELALMIAGSTDAGELDIRSAVRGWALSSNQEIPPAEILGKCRDMGCRRLAFSVEQRSEGEALVRVVVTSVPKPVDGVAMASSVGYELEIVKGAEWRVKRFVRTWIS